MAKRVYGTGWFADVPYGMDATWDVWLDAHETQLTLRRSENGDPASVSERAVVEYTPDVVLWRDPESRTVVWSCGGLLVGWCDNGEGGDDECFQCTDALVLSLCVDE